MKHPLVTLSDIVEQLSRDTGVSHATVRLVSRRLFESIKDAMRSQTEVEIPDFGRFGFRLRKEKISHSLGELDDTYTPAHSSIHFTPDRKWISWQRVHSAVLPNELPAGTRLGVRFATSAHIRQQLGDAAPDIHRSAAEQSFFDNVIVKRAMRRNGA